jgi:hypothetical protein
MALVTLEAAKAQLKFSSMPDAEDEDIQRRIDMAEAIVLDYLESSGSPSPYEGDKVVEAAILYQVVELYRFRGDDPEGEGPALVDGYLSPVVKNLLHRRRAQVIA